MSRVLVWIPYFSNIIFFFPSKTKPSSEMKPGEAMQSGEQAHLHVLDCTKILISSAFKIDSIPTMQRERGRGRGRESGISSKITVRDNNHKLGDRYIF